MAGYLARRAGEPIPAVNPADLRGVWELIRQSSAQSPGASFDIALLAGACAPGADAFAVSFRVALLEGLVGQGLLVLDEAVFDFAATFPIPRLDKFDPDEFLRRLHDRRSRASF
jgi:hypothetical protein